MTTHTPGPWEARPDSENAFSAWSVYAVNDQNGYICTTSGNAKADARLIAAAPDLLEALREIAELPVSREMQMYGDNKAADIARAVIAKATGKE